MTQLTTKKRLLIRQHKSLRRCYQNLTGKVFSGPDGIFNCGCGFPDYARWDEFGIGITRF